MANLLAYTTHYAPSGVWLLERSRPYHYFPWLTEEDNVLLLNIVADQN